MLDRVLFIVQIVTLLIQLTVVTAQMITINKIYEEEKQRDEKEQLSQRNETGDPRRD